MSIMLIFGAGASRFCGECYPHNPPLGNDLFNELIAGGDIPKNIVEEYGNIFLNEGFEAGMAALRPLGSDAFLPIQRQTAVVLSKFVLGENNYYSEILDRIGRRGIAKIAFASLNYDLLLEQALRRKTIDFKYAGETKNENPKAVPLLKLHGSSNFLPCFPNNFTLNGSLSTKAEIYLNGLPMNAVDDHSDVIRWVSEKRNEYLTPVLSVYGKAKISPCNQSFIEEIQKQWRGALSRADLIVLIGINYVPHDTHFWDELKLAPGKIGIVNPDISGYEEWINQRGSETFHLARTFSEVDKIADTIKLHMVNS